MNRRNFLSLIPAALIGATLDPEKLLWVPGKISYHFINSPIPEDVYQSIEFDHIYWEDHDYQTKICSAWLHSPTGKAYKEIQALVSLIEEDKKQTFFNHLTPYDWMTKK